MNEHNIVTDVAKGLSDKNTNEQNIDTDVAKDISNIPIASSGQSLDDIGLIDMSTQDLAIIDDIMNSVTKQPTNSHKLSVANPMENKKAEAKIPLWQPSFTSMLDSLDNLKVHVTSKSTIVDDAKKMFPGESSSLPLQTNLGPNVQSSDKIHMFNPSRNANLTGFGRAVVDGSSTTQNVNVARQQVVPGKHYTNAQKKGYGTSPLDEFFWDASDLNKAKDFDAWLFKGTLARPKMTSNGVQYYKSRCSDIKPAFNFNVAIINDKNWFHRLDGPGENWHDTHVDVIFYYTRKLALYSMFVVYKRYTTTDVFFYQTIKELYTSYAANSSDTTKINLLSPIVDYMLGYTILCGTSWFEVDHILFPMKICIKDKVVWMLGRFDIIEGLFWAYNARRFEEADLIEAVQPYLTLIPLFLNIVGFYKSRTDIDLSYGWYKNRCITSPLSVAIAEILPVIAPGDSGLHMATHAEYFITEDDIMGQDFDVASHRKRLAFLMWKHAKNKVVVDFKSEDESPGPLPAQMREEIFIKNVE